MNKTIEVTPKELADIVCALELLKLTTERHDAAIAQAVAAGTQESVEHLLSEPRSVSRARTASLLRRCKKL